MYFLFSGEGPTDLGLCAEGAESCEGESYQAGPLAVIVDQLVESQHGYSPLETGHCGFVSRKTLTDRAGALKAVRKSVRLPGKKRSRETRYFFNHARMMARIAREREAAADDDVVAVLFRDSDTATAGRGEWSPKWQSMLDGFADEGFNCGIPMLPKPTSEAWLLCALKEQPYENCHALERRSSSPKARRPLKTELEDRLGQPPSREAICHLVADRTIDCQRIQMQSFRSFRERLKEVI